MMIQETSGLKLLKNKTYNSFSYQYKCLQLLTILNISNNIITAKIIKFELWGTRVSVI